MVPLSKITPYGASLLALIYSMRILNNSIYYGQKTSIDKYKPQFFKEASKQYEHKLYKTLFL